MPVTLTLTCSACGAVQRVEAPARPESHLERSELARAVGWWTVYDWQAHRLVPVCSDTCRLARKAAA